MPKIDFTLLNSLERKIHAKLSSHSETAETIRITEAAELCDCSASKISKFVSKLGFENFKEYLDFLYGRSSPSKKQSGELQRLESFLASFDTSMVDEMVKLIKACDKVVLLGYGPSFLCAQYFEYRLKTCANKIAIAASDDLSARSLADENTLLLVFTVTGSFRSFMSIYSETKDRGGDVALVIDEYNPSFIHQYDKVFCLTRNVQTSDLRPYEKSRTTFFIFMEEVIRGLMRLR